MKDTINLIASAARQETIGALNRAQRRNASRCKTTKRQASGAQSMVGRSIKASTDTKTFRDLILSTRVQILMTDDGAEATELLASLAVVIGTPCQAGANQYGMAPPWVRQLHGALRTVQDLCRQGYRWQAKYAAALEVAVGIAAQDRPELDPAIFAKAWDDAVGFADRIFGHDISEFEVAA